jgi:scyllo-inositol 2-dehydrogenase (NADP+)
MPYYQGNLGFGQIIPGTKATVYDSARARGVRSGLASATRSGDAQMINTVVVGHGLAGRSFHCPLIRRQPKLRLHGIVARDPRVRDEAVALWGDSVRGYADLDQALADPAVELIVIATPHDSHADLAVRALEASKHCVVDKVMALTTAEADRMIAARDRSGSMLSVFHNRRWDWDFLTVKSVLVNGRLGRPLLVESSVCRYAPPRTWRGSLAAAGTILHDWGAHLVDQALQLGLGPCRRLTAWLIPAPWEAVDSGGHGRIMMEFDDVLFQVESSRVCCNDRPRWWIVGTEGGFVKHGIDPQEDALRSGDIDRAYEPSELQGTARGSSTDGKILEWRVATVKGHWDSYYHNVAEHLTASCPLTVTAEEAREVVRLLEAAITSSREHLSVQGPWGQS